MLLLSRHSSANVNAEDSATECALVRSNDELFEGMVKDAVEKFEGRRKRLVLGPMLSSANRSPPTFSSPFTGPK